LNEDERSGHVARVGAIRNSCRCLVEKLKRREPLGALGLREENDIKTGRKCIRCVLDLVG
jgi:hypothetical protein